MRLTGTFSRVANIPMRMDAGELREQLANDFLLWRTEGGRSTDWVRSFWVRVKHLAKMIGETKEEVYREIQEDADRMDEENIGDGDLDRTSAKKYKAVNPWAVCHSQLGPEKDEKFERCVQDVKKTHKIKKD